MGYTMAEKLLACRSGAPGVSAGTIVTAEPDCAMMDDILGPQVFEEDFERLGGRIRFPDRAVLICDHYVPPATIHQANIVARSQRWAREKGLIHCFSGQGPCHQILAEQGFSLPGTLQVGTDSHTCTAGAFGCFGTGIGSTEMAGVLATGEIWLRVPESIRVEWTGRPERGVMAKDMMLKTIGALGHAGATYMAIEFTGDAIRSMPMDERMCLCNLAVEAGAKTGLIAPDEVTEAYLEAHGCDRPYAPVHSDPDAVYARTLSFDAGALPPQISCPHKVDAVCDVSAVAGTPIDQAYLGSCTGGRLHDLRAAAELLKGRRVASSCRLLVSPASMRVWMQAEREGLLRILAEAGATVLAPSCGACLGVHSGLLADGEVCVSTTNRNFKGRMGSEGSFVYLASPATMAASALTGKITDPRTALQEEGGGSDG